eukprot:TRINITY_DN1680_c0_g1_i1.p1 TRINITY_DN1680_c0_g1~~TRINITY_DN1680_c0_g1_i1.p1  ORF type:complete len:294 (+),score=47.84 TRINITY_DN1680_c0_g1_i1:356-1237(+)
MPSFVKDWVEEVVEASPCSPSVGRPPQGPQQNLPARVEVWGPYADVKEVWSSISSLPGGRGTVYWANNAQCGISPGAVGIDIVLPCGQRLWFNAFDAPGDGWRGAKFLVRVGNVVVADGRWGPTDATDRDSERRFETSQSARCVESELEATQPFFINCPHPGMRLAHVGVYGGKRADASSHWTSITDGQKGQGEVLWSSGSKCGSGLGSIRKENALLPCDQAIYFNAYDKAGNGWGDAKYRVWLADGRTMAANEGQSPDNGVDNDSSSGWDAQDRVCVYKELEVYEKFRIPCA